MANKYLFTFNMEGTRMKNERTSRPSQSRSRREKRKQHEKKSETEFVLGFV